LNPNRTFRATQVKTDSNRSTQLTVWIEQGKIKIIIMAQTLVKQGFSVFFLVRFGRFAKKLQKKTIDTYFILC
jgi:hypothetical protein